MSSSKVVYSNNRNLDSCYHRRSCPKAKALPPGIRRTGVAAQLRQWGWSACPVCDPDNAAADIAKFAVGERTPKREPLDKKRGKK